MNAMTAMSLLPFVPSGAQYEMSRRFFTELGFEDEWENAGYAGFRNGEARFILQRLDDQTFSRNFMLTIVVKDLDAWWAEVAPKQLEKSYPGVAIKPPTEFPWAR